MTNQGISINNRIKLIPRKIPPITKSVNNKSLIVENNNSDEENN